MSPLVAIAAECAGQCTSTAYNMGDGDVAHLVLALERLKLRLLDDGDVTG